MPTKIFRYWVAPTKIQASVDQPPTAIKLKGAFDGVCSPADLEDFPEDRPAQNAKPPWFRLDYADLIVRSRFTAQHAYPAILFEVTRLVSTSPESVRSVQSRLRASLPRRVGGPTRRRALAVGRAAGGGRGKRPSVRPPARTRKERLESPVRRLGPPSPDRGIADLGAWGPDRSDRLTGLSTTDQSAPWTRIPPPRSPDEPARTWGPSRRDDAGG
jgi:hypothetical protein